MTRPLLLLAQGKKRKRLQCRYFIDCIDFLFCKVSFIKKHSVYNILVLPLLED